MTILFDPPENLDGTLGGGNVNLTWDPPPLPVSSETLTTSGTWNPPNNLWTSAQLEGLAAGGGGSGGSRGIPDTTGGAPGGGGEYRIRTITPSDVVGGVSVTMGVGGAHGNGNTGDGTDGVDGTNTVFGSLMTCVAGTKGIAKNGGTNPIPGSGGTGGSGGVGTAGKGGGAVGTPIGAPSAGGDSGSGKSGPGGGGGAAPGFNGARGGNSTGGSPAGGPGGTVAAVDNTFGVDATNGSDGFPGSGGGGGAGGNPGASHTNARTGTKGGDGGPGAGGGGGGSGFGSGVEGPAPGADGGRGGDGRIKLTYTYDAASLDPPEGYIIYRDGEQVGTSTTPDFSDSGLVPQGSYTYTVVAAQFDGSEWVPVSDESNSFVITFSLGDKNLAVRGFVDERVFQGYLGGKLEGTTIACPGDNVNKDEPCC